MAGESNEHARLLAESEEALPPIVVQRSTMRVIDGMHRLKAATLRGLTEILVQFYDGDDDGAFVLAVQANNAHGLPLSLPDRTSAAARIITAHPNWSNRKVASIVGLSATTVASIRRRSSDHSGHLHAGERLGRDGRIRPLNIAAGRRRASELIKDRPDAPVREIAKAAGVSTGTVVNIRNQLRRSQQEAPRQQHAQKSAQPPHKHSRSSEESIDAADDTDTDDDMVLQSLKRDPSLRFTNAGRTLLRLLDVNTLGLRRVRQYLDSVPEHCVHAVAKLARRNSDAWRQIAVYLERRLNAEL